MVGDRVKWSWEVTCCHFILYLHFILSLHSTGGVTRAMTGCCDNVWDLLTLVNDPDHYIQMDYVGHPDVSWKPFECFMFISVVWPLLRQAGYEGASCVSGWGDPDCLRATCQYEVCCTCSQEEESLQCGHGKVAFPGEEMSYSWVAFTSIFNLWRPRKL